MPIFDACLDHDIRIIHTRHEAAAVYMADAWGQINGSIGVALVAAGPGFTNCLCGLYAAKMAQSPVLLISGDSPRARDGQGAFQEMAQSSISSPLTKYSTRVTDARAIRSQVIQAARIALAHRPGPVHLAFPFDILQITTAQSNQPVDQVPIEEVEAELDQQQIDTIVDQIAKSSCPIILIGPALGPNRPGIDIETLGGMLMVPVLCLDSPRGLNAPDMGNLKSQLNAADLIISLGKDLDFTLDFASPKIFSPAIWIMVDNDRQRLDQAAAVLESQASILLQVDPESLAKQMMRQICQNQSRLPQPTEWQIRIDRARETRQKPQVPTSQRVLPTDLCRAIQQFIDQAREPILICDGGEFGQWAQGYLTAPTRLINGMSGGIGGSICQGIAASISQPGAPVLVLMGDGTAGFHFSEFETAVREDTPIIVIIGNDARWNAEYQIQLKHYGKDRLNGCELSPARYDIAASGLGCHGEYVTTIDQMTGALTRSAGSGKPACINIEIEGLAAPICE